MIEDILLSLPPDQRKLLGVGSDYHIEKQPTPSLLMNDALGGGLAYGRQVLLYGGKSTGKSTLSLQMVADAQKRGKSCAWIDSENSFDPGWATLLGVDTDELIVSRAHAINHAVDISIALMKGGIDVLVIDSVTACLPAVFFDKGELKDLSDTKQMGSDARDWSHALKMLSYSNKNTLMVLISQHRKSLGKMFVKNIPTGGEAMKFYSSTVIRLQSSESEAQAIKGIIDINGKPVEKVIGREVNWLIEANKLGRAFESGTYRLMFGGDDLGVDTVEELLTLIEINGLTKKEGAWYYLFDGKYHGREKLVKALREDKALQERARNELGI